MGAALCMIKTYWAVGHGGGTGGLGLLGVRIMVGVCSMRV